MICWKRVKLKTILFKLFYTFLSFADIKMKLEIVFRKLTRRVFNFYCPTWMKLELSYDWQVERLQFYVCRKFYFRVKLFWENIIHLILGKFFCFDMSNNMRDACHFKLSVYLHKQHFISYAAIAQFMFTRFPCLLLRCLHWFAFEQTFYFSLLFVLWIPRVSLVCLLYALYILSKSLCKRCRKTDYMKILVNNLRWDKKI